MAQALVGGHAPSIAAAVMEVESVQKAIIGIYSERISRECGILCQKLADSPSCFRTIPVNQLDGFSWEAMLGELKDKAPILLDVLTTIVSFSDHRNKVKVGCKHNPGICTAVAVLLKERNRQMSGLQSILSMLMYVCHCEKQVIRIHRSYYGHIKLCYYARSTIG